MTFKKLFIIYPTTPGLSRKTTFMQYIGMDEKRDGFTDAFMEGMSQLEM